MVNDFHIYWLGPSEWSDVLWRIGAVYGGIEVSIVFGLPLVKNFNNYDELQARGTWGLVRQLDAAERDAAPLGSAYVGWVR